MHLNFNRRISISHIAKSTFSLIILFSLFLFSACTTDSVSSGIRPTSSIGEQNNTQTAAITPADQPPQNTTALAGVEPAQTQPDTQTAALEQPVQTPSPGVNFLPVLGPPQSAVTKLSSAVRNYARTNAVTIVPNGQPGAKYQVKGYFSALDDGSGTRFIFIWDVLDASGKNIHRISGEERTSSRGADPWGAVDSRLINKVVERTMQNLKNWMNTRA